jgi:hypothetical protein
MMSTTPHQQIGIVHDSCQVCGKIHTVIGSQEDVNENGEKEPHRADKQDVGSQESNYDLLVDMLKIFEGCRGGNLNTSQDSTCSFRCGNLDIQFNMGSQNKIIFVSTVVHNPDATRKRLYSLMTKVTKLNITLPNMKISSCQGKIVAFHSICATLLKGEEKKQVFYALLRDFLVSAVNVEKELSDTRKRSRKRSHSM